MTPFLWLVAPGFTLFVAVLGGVSIWCGLPSRQARPIAVRARVSEPAARRPGRPT